MFVTSSFGMSLFLPLTVIGTSASFTIRRRTEDLLYKSYTALNVMDASKRPLLSGPKAGTILNGTTLIVLTTITINLRLRLRCLGIYMDKGMGS